MAKATVCDKCGKVLKYACDCTITIYKHPFGDTKYDLCNDCKQKISNWLQKGELK